MSRIIKDVTVVPGRKYVPRQMIITWQDTGDFTSVSTVGKEAELFTHREDGGVDVHHVSPNEDHAIFAHKIARRLDPKHFK